MDSTYFNSRYTFVRSREKVWKAICEYLQVYIPEHATVLELGAGYCDFINQISAHKKYALDANPNVAKYCSLGVEFIHSNTDNIPINTGVADVIFASNLLEHLYDQELQKLFNQIKNLLKPGGKIILIQPNIFYCYREYWDDFTHTKAFSHISLSDFLKSHGFKIIMVERRFLPFSFKSKLPKSYILTRTYLKLFWRPMAKQMLVVAEKI